MGWKLYADHKPEKKGFYLIAADSTSGMIFPDICEYFRAGDVVSYTDPKQDYTGRDPLHSFLDIKPIYAEEDGFYTYALENSGDVWQVIPTYWKKLPKPPKGCHYEEP